jgi:hypothetical protein
MSAVEKKLDAGEFARLHELERVVKRGAKTFLAVGNALAEIRDSKLYRESHSSFAAYLDERWGMSRARGYQLIAAAELSTTVDTPPETEREARRIARRQKDESISLKPTRGLLRALGFDPDNPTDVEKANKELARQQRERDAYNAAEKLKPKHAPGEPWFSRNHQHRDGTFTPDGEKPKVTIPLSAFAPDALTETSTRVREAEVIEDAEWEEIPVRERDDVNVNLDAVRTSLGAAGYVPSPEQAEKALATARDIVVMLEAVLGGYHVGER